MKVSGEVHALAAYPPGKSPQCPLGRLRHKTEAKEKMSAPAENLTLVFQLVTCHYIDLATQADRLIAIILNFRRPMKNGTERCTEVKQR
jgi:hypothetical protein